MFLIRSILLKSARPCPPHPIRPARIRSLAPAILSLDEALCPRVVLAVSAPIDAAAPAAPNESFKNCRRVFYFILPPPPPRPGCRRSARNVGREDSQARLPR